MTFAAVPRLDHPRDQARRLQAPLVAGAYWHGDEKLPMLTRIYAYAFSSKAELEAHLKMLEEAERRDHRRIGKDLDLFSTHEEAGPVSSYWHPKGGRFRVELENWWREEHYRNGYEILFTPHIGKSWLWETSGHLGFYKANMYSPMKIDENDYYAKPMNCPFHIMIYKNSTRSYRDLPLRWAELGTVYRYERSGVLHGLMRVRGFTQDDAHIICTPEQIEGEIAEVLRFSLNIWRPWASWTSRHTWRPSRRKERSATTRAGRGPSARSGGASKKKASSTWWTRAVAPSTDPRST